MPILIRLNGIEFAKSELSFAYFDRENVFSLLNNKTVKATLEKSRYCKCQQEVYSKYKIYLDYRIGDFLAILKTNNDSLYRRFLNYYGDLKYCNFKINDVNVLARKGLYLYKHGDKIMYIGRCRDNFRSRINNGYGRISPKNCYLDGQATNCHINSLINSEGDAIKLYVSFFERDEEIEKNEKILIRLVNPPWNILLK